MQGNFSESNSGHGLASAAGGCWPAAVQRLVGAFADMDGRSLGVLETLYARNVVFVDPAHRLDGLEALRAYFARLYRLVARTEVASEQVLATGGEAALLWRMRVSPLGGGDPWTVPGASHIRFGERIDYHRDYFDLGALVYERVPLLGGVVRAVKRRI